MIRRSALIACLLIASSLLSSVYGATVIPPCDQSLAQLNVPQPWYETPISSNPSSACGGSCNYGWQASDPNDSAELRAIHTNMLTFAGGAGNTASNYVNISASTGVNSVGGTGLPGQVFASTAGDIRAGTAGWSFEATFKATAQKQWQKIFDISNPNSGGCRDDVVFGFTDNTLHTEFTWCNSNGGEVKLMSFRDLIISDWYHVVIVVQQIGNTAGTGMFVNPQDPNANSNWHVYINGVSYGQYIDGYQPSTRPGPYPTGVTRRDVTLGRSSWGDQFFTGSIRTFNIYNQAITAKQIDALYRKRMGSSCSLQTGPTATSGLISAPVYSGSSTPPNPIWALPVDTRPSNADGTHYGWMQNDPVDVSCGLATQHSGLIVLGGSYDEGLGAAAGGPYINLAATTGPNSIPQTTPFPNIGGNSAGDVNQGTFGWTIELVMKPQLIETWAKAYDFANPQVGGSCRDNIVSGWQDNGPGWTFTTCDSRGTEYNNRYTALQLNIAQWSHAVMIIQQQPNGNATYLVYVNGELLSHNPGQYYPPGIVRSNAFLGRSSWANDFFWDGYIDYFNIYNYALTAPQVASLYGTKMGTNAGTNKFYCPVAYNPINDITFIESTKLFRATFENDPRSAAGGAASALYGWVDADAADTSADASVHKGLLQLNQGSISNQYVNLTALSGPYSINIPSTTQDGLLDTSKVGGRETSGNVFNGTAGFTFEITWKATGQPTWAKLFDIGAIRTGGNCNYDIFFGFHASDAQDLDFQICDWDGSAFGPAPFTNTLGTLNVWHHFVASIAQTQNGRANYTLYMDGSVAWSGTNQYYPTALPRPNALLGDSNWNDANWQGYIDTFAIYKQALNPTQVGLLYSRAMIPVSLPSCDATASQVPVPAPWFALNVTADPRGNNGVPSSAGYGWLSYDSNDAQPVQAVHNGLIVLGGGAAGTVSQFVNLSTRTGANSVGYVLNGFMGGSGAIDAVASKGTAGWTFEVTVKPTAKTTFGKIFDFGASRNSATPGTCNEDILLGFNGDSTALQFGYCNARGAEQSIYTSTQLNIGQWYHITAVIQQLVGPDGQGTGLAYYYLYINNVLAGNILGTLPSAVYRANSDIGKSGWNNDVYFQGMLDSLNIYNYALNSRQVSALYFNKMGNGCGMNVVIGTPNNPASANFNSRAVPFADPSVPTGIPSGNDLHYQLQTETRPATVDASFYNWIQQDDSDISCGINTYHQGIIQLGGSSNPGTEGPYINMSAATGPRSIGGTNAPLRPIGGAGTGNIDLGTRGWTFEFVVKPIIVEEWSKLFDIGNPQVNGVCRDDILTGWEGYGPEWSFTVCDENGNQATMDNAFGGNVNVTDWTHGVIVIQQQLDGSGNYFIYGNGKLLDSKPATIYPALKARTNAFLGRSNWAADSYFDGNIDLFKIYSVAATPSQVRTMWNAASNNGQAAATCNAAPPTSGLIDASNVLLDLTFESDPRPAAGGAGVARFGWNQVDSTDSSDNQRVHTGLLTLAGGGTPNANFNGNYVNLTERSGPTFIGKTLDPWAIGDVGKGNENAGTAGWTWEITFKPTTSANWGKIFDFGAQRPTGSCRADLLFGQYGNNQSVYSFSSCDQRGNEYGLRPAIDRIQANAWNHVLLILELGPNGQGIYTTYLNGRQQPYVESQGWYPTILPRVHGLIGRSNWGADDYWAGHIDTFRIYSVAATPYQADTLYKKMLDPNYNPVDPGASSSSSSSGLSGGAIAGIVIGSVVGAIILAIIAAVVCCGLGARSKKSSSTDYDSNRGNNASHRFDEMEASRNVEMSNVQGETHDNEETV